MWPFARRGSKTQSGPESQILFSQVDTTKNFGDNRSLTPGDWIKTTPLNSMIEDGQSMGLPAVGASEDEVYGIAARLSLVRESVSIPSDGVYCPVCHIANVELGKLRAPC